MPRTKKQKEDKENKKAKKSVVEEEEFDELDGLLDDEDDEDVDVDDLEVEDDEDEDEVDEDDEDEEEEEEPAPPKKKSKKEPEVKKPAKVEKTEKKATKKSDDEEGYKPGAALHETVPEGHLTVADVARKVGVKPKYIRQLIRDRFLPSWSKGKKNNEGRRYHWGPKDPQLKELLDYFQSGKYDMDQKAKRERVAEVRENFAKMAKEKAAARKAQTVEDVEAELEEEVKPKAKKKKK